jgi:hypothetical protein
MSPDLAPERNFVPPQAGDSPDKALQLVQELIERQIKNFADSKRFYRRGSLVQTISSASVAAITALVIALDQIYHRTWLAALSLVAAALTTILAAWGGWFGFRRLWVSNQMTLNRLYELRASISYQTIKTDGRLEPSAVDAYFDQYQSILSDANRAWEETRSAQD